MSDKGNQAGSPEDVSSDIASSLDDGWSEDASSQTAEAERGRCGQAAAV